MSRHSPLHFCFFLIGLSLLWLWGSATITPLSELSITAPGAYPLLIAGLCLICSLWAATGTQRESKNGQNIPQTPLFPADITGFVFLMALYFLFMELLHYTLDTLLFTFFSIWFLDRTNWKQSLLVAYVSTFMILLVFKYVFSVILP